MPDLNDLFGFRPDRPTHPDMTTLSNVVLRHDGNTEDPDFDYDRYIAQVINPATLVYMATQRAMRVVGPFAPPEALAKAASLFLDGFLIGSKFEPARRESYNEACKRAATNQGLDPVLAALENTPGSQLEQTGGFTMVVTVACKDGTFGITASDEEADRYLVGWYPGDMWDSGEGHENADYHDGLTIEQVVEMIDGHRQT